MTFQSSGSVPLNVDQAFEPNVTPSSASSETRNHDNDHPHPATSPSLVTPSLSLAKSRGAYELKFLVAEDRAREIMDWARTHLAPDPHSDSESNDGYRVNSLYLDTPKFDVFHRTGFCGRRKYRLRQKPILTAAPHWRLMAMRTCRLCKNTRGRSKTRTPSLCLRSY